MESTVESVAAHTRSRCKRKTLLKGLKIVEKKRSRRVQISNSLEVENMNHTNYAPKDVNIALSLLQTEEKESKADDDSRENVEKVVVLQETEIAKSDDPRAEMKKVLSCLQSSDWLTQYENVDSLRRLCIHHYSVLVPKIPLVLPFLQNSVESLRSAQSRNALFAVSELYKFSKLGQRSALLVNIDRTVDVVLTKSVNDKRFLAIAGSKALANIAKAVPCYSLFASFLRHSGNKSAKRLSQVANGAKLCLDGMKAGGDIKETKLEKVIKAIVQLETGRSTEARKPAQAMMVTLYNSHDKTSFRLAMKKVLSSNDYERVVRLIEKNKNKQNGKPRKASLKELMMQRRQQAQQELAPVFEIQGVSTTDNLEKSLNKAES